MNNPLYYKINITNKNEEIEYLKHLSDEKFFIVGIEVTDPDIEQYCSLSIDPQHSKFKNMNSQTSIEYIFNYQEDIVQLMSLSKNIIMLTIKTDNDSIGSMAVLTLLLKNNLILDGDIILRLKAIAKSDRHGRKNWKGEKEDYFNFENYNMYGLPSGLSYMSSDLKITIDNKIDNMIQYLSTGDFPSLSEYNDLTLYNLKKNNKQEHITIIIPKKLCFVESNHRGAISFGYKYTPCVIAKNKKFVFGNGNTRKIGKKVTIAQYEDSKYVNLDNICRELNDIELGWGGSSVIIGSPLDRATSISDDQIIDIVKKHIY